jgi:hypothetical protein
MLARQPGFRFQVEIFHSKIFFRRKEKKRKMQLFCFDIAGNAGEGVERSHLVVLSL